MISENLRRLYLAAANPSIPSPGDTDLHDLKPSLTLGTVQLGKPYGIANPNGQPSRSKALEILSQAWQAGVRSFDTAPNYGDSESILKTFLQGRTEQDFFITTKIGTIPKDPQVQGLDLQEMVMRSARQSASDLGLTILPGLILQYAPDVDRYPELLPSLMAVKEAGLAREVGLSAYYPQDAERLLRHPELSIIQLPLNLFDHRFVQNDLLPRLKRRGVKVFVRSVFLQGLFFLSPQGLPPNLRPAAAHLQRLKTLSQELGREMDDLALAFVRSLPGIFSLVLGLETSAQLARNLKLMSTPPLPPGVVDEILSIFKDVSEDIINPINWNTWK
jgi:aryl-alcohol dehydrogenase-like predicted oxidoreductase